jgi:hypothetical protein
VTVKLRTDIDVINIGNILGELGSVKPYITSHNGVCSGGIFSKYIKWSCNQIFPSIPISYTNLVSVFEETNHPLGFLIKIPRSQEEHSEITSK